MREGFAAPPAEVANTAYGLPRVVGRASSLARHPACTFGGESLAVVPYLMDPAMVLLERFAKRWTHGVITPQGFAGYGWGCSTAYGVAN